ncbi:hypothetical protein HAX54_032911, partial [Datura stramonium]|nr:hypothetical protein [Datura stramonium]
SKRWGSGLAEENMIAIYVIGCARVHGEDERENGSDGLSENGAGPAESYCSQRSNDGEGEKKREGHRRVAHSTMVLRQ